MDKFQIVECKRLHSTIILFHECKENIGHYTHKDIDKNKQFDKNAHEAENDVAIWVKKWYILIAIDCCR